MAFSSRKKVLTTLTSWPFREGRKSMALSSSPWANLLPAMVQQSPLCALTWFPLSSGRADPSLSCQPWMWNWGAARLSLLHLSLPRTCCTLQPMDTSFFAQECVGDQSYQRPAPLSPHNPTLKDFPAPIPPAGDQPIGFALSRDFLACYVPLDFLWHLWTPCCPSASHKILAAQNLWLSNDAEEIPSQPLLLSAFSLMPWQAMHIPRTQAANSNLRQDFLWLENICWKHQSAGGVEEAPMCWTLQSVLEPSQELLSVAKFRSFPASNSLGKNSVCHSGDCCGLEQRGN